MERTIISSLLPWYVAARSCLAGGVLTPKQTLTICYVILLFILREKGIGFPMSTLTPAQMVGFMKVS